MFIVEIMLAVFVGTVTYIMCVAAGQKPLATMAKLITAFICVDIALRVVVPVFHSVKEKADAIEKKVDRIEQGVRKVEELPDKVPTKKDFGNWLDEQLHGPERRGKER